MTWLMLTGITIVMAFGIATAYLILRDHRRRMAALMPPIHRVEHIPSEVCDIYRMRLNRQAEQISELKDQTNQQLDASRKAKIAFIVHWSVTVALLTAVALLAIRVWGL